MSIESMAERLLREEIREKKRTGNSIHHKTGARGYVGKMRFPTDLMTAKQKRNYVRSGVVMSWNMNEVLPKMEFDAYDKEQQKEMLTVWRANFSNKEIMKKMGIQQYYFYRMLDVLDVPKEAKTAPKRKGTSSRSIAIAAAPKVVELVERKPTIEQTTAPVFTSGLNLNINGTYTADTISTWLTKIQMLVEGTGEYDVVIHVREKKI